MCAIAAPLVHEALVGYLSIPDVGAQQQQAFSPLEGPHSNATKGKFQESRLDCRLWSAIFGCRLLVDHILNFGTRRRTCLGRRARRDNRAIDPIAGTFGLFNCRPYDVCISFRKVIACALCAVNKHEKTRITL